MSVIIKKYDLNQKPAAQAEGVLRVGAEEVMKQLACSRCTLHHYIKSKKFPAPLYLGSKRLWSQEEVNTWIAANLTSEPQVNNLAA